MTSPNAFFVVTPDGDVTFDLAPFVQAIDDLRDIVNPGGVTPGMEIDLSPVVNAINSLKDAVIQKPLPDNEGPEIVIHVVTVATPLTPVQGPGVPIPRGWSISLRMRYHTGSPVGYWAGTQAALANTNTRSEIKDNDAIILQVSDLNQLWFDADTSNTIFELILQQK